MISGDISSLDKLR